MLVFWPLGTVVEDVPGYSYSLAETDHDGNNATPRRWNFDWTVNTDLDDFFGARLDEFTYELGMDGDRGTGTNFLRFDPITPTGAVPFFDHSIGDNTTANGGGVEAGDAVAYSNLLATNNVLQQSWRYSFFSVLPPLNLYDPDLPGIYSVYLLARDEHGRVVARSDILVLIGLLPVDRDECKKGGWATFDSIFTNQGDCVSFVNTGK